MNFLRERRLSQAASDLIEFDAASIRQVASGRRFADPDVWLVDPDAYEKNGRVLRDSESPRMLAYSTKDGFLYATDGCNSCAQNTPVRLDILSPEDLKRFAEGSELRLELLEKLTEIVRAH